MRGVDRISGRGVEQGSPWSDRDTDRGEGLLYRSVRRPHRMKYGSHNLSTISILGGHVAQSIDTGICISR